ncbi:cyclase family protein [Salipiger sp. P9]|uniref:cyclase family protein n=1 Tax=Salipiger pentaromativorans TaxID=2943193 RepID=UPI00215779D8|nr:cyclase family protein [Salipiger pentaromativorans]MCR8551104.1 cyclase family protein [Salipiger pentaromativorans]
MTEHMHTKLSNTIVDTGTIEGLLTSGRFYELGHPFEQGMTHSPNHPPFLYSLVKKHSDFVRGSFSAASDIIAMGLHQGTHIDALGHVSEDCRIHGGGDARARQDLNIGLTDKDICSLTPVFGRGRLLDVAGFKGKAFLDEGYEISAEDLAATAESQGIRLEPGDVALVRTGWANLFHDEARYYAYRGPSYAGVAPDGAQWLVDQGVRAVGADNAAFEPRNPEGPVHQLLLVRAGVPIMENLFLNELAETKIYTFLYVGIPLRIVGATGSPLRPLAIV